MKMKILSLLVAAPLLCGASVIASNDTSQTGDYTSYGFNSNENFYISFSVSQTFEGVDFFVQFTNPGTSFSGTAYLTTSVGAGTQQNNEIAESAFTVPATGTVNLVDVLGGQELLAGNTYYLTLGTSSANGGSISATRTNEHVVTLDPAVSNLTYGEVFGQIAPYAPASSFGSLGCCSSGLVFEAGNLAPEPSTAVLLLPAILLLPFAAFVRRQRRSGI